MENIVLIIILYFIGSLVADKAERSRRKKRGDFEIPPVYDEKLKLDTQFNTDAKPIEEVKNLKSDDKKTEIKEDAFKSDKSLVLTKENVRTGFILAEILNKPKAYRHL